MVTVESATVEHATGICRVCSASWRDAYADVLPAEYVDANVRLRYDPERIAGQIEASDESGDTGGSNDTDDSNDTGDTDDNDATDAIGPWLVALDGGTDEPESEPDDPEASESVVGAVRDDRPESGVGEVSDLYVHPDRQGEGVGSRLLDALTERQRDRGATQQRVYVFADHDEAIGFYESKGFAADERFSAAAVDGVDPDCEAVRFSRSL